LGVKGPQQITDGHLLRLAKAHGAEMATPDERAPGAFVITGIVRTRDATSREIDEFDVIRDCAV